jgi:tetratricopeptide (TPR) repeat protein
MLAAPSMAQILKLPVRATKLGYRRVKRRCRGGSESPDQLHLFAQPTAEILAFASDLSPFERALALDERGDDKAADLYSKAIEEQDCVADSFCNLGIIESQRGNTIKAFDCFTTALKHDPRHSEAHYNLGNLYFDLNDFRLAQIHFEMAAQVDPFFANAFFNLALVRVINNDPASDQALGQYRELVSSEEAEAAEDLVESLKRNLNAGQLFPRCGQ